MTLYLRRPSPMPALGVPFYTGAAEGDVIAVSGAKVAAVADAVFGLLFGVPIVTDGQMKMLEAQGVGAIFEDTAVTFTPKLPVYSNGTGGYTQTQPNPGAGASYYVLGYALTTKQFIIAPSLVVDNA